MDSVLPLFYLIRRLRAAPHLCLFLRRCRCDWQPTPGVRGSWESAAAGVGARGVPAAGARVSESTHFIFSHTLSAPSLRSGHARYGECTGISHILLAGWLRYCRILSARGRARARGGGGGGGGNFCISAMLIQLLSSEVGWSSFLQEFSQ
jgi:hypothetical protein